MGSSTIGVNSITHRIQSSNFGQEFCLLLKIQPHTPKSHRDPGDPAVIGQNCARSTRCGMDLSSGGHAA